MVSSASGNELHFGFSDSKPDGNIPLGDFDFASQGLLFRAAMGELIIPEVSNIGYRVGAQTNRQRAFMLKGGSSLARGNHSFRLGGEFTYYQYNMGVWSRGCNGVIEFAGLRTFLQAMPRRFEVMLPGGDIVNRDMRQSLRRVCAG